MKVCVPNSNKYMSATNTHFPFQLEVRRERRGSGVHRDYYKKAENHSKKWFHVQPYFGGVMINGPPQTGYCDKAVGKSENQNLR